MHIWEVATCEIVTWEVPHGKMPLGKYLTPFNVQGYPNRMRILNLFNLAGFINCSVPAYSLFFLSCHIIKFTIKKYSRLRIKGIESLCNSNFLIPISWQLDSVKL